MSDALRFEGVVKRYGRKTTALDGLTFRIPRGCIAGFVGHNGAGKTTAFSVVSGYLPPDEGTVDILGLGTFHATEMKGQLGVLPQDAELPDRHTPTELLVHLARLQGMTRRESVREAERVLHLVGLGDRQRSLIATLSHGMRRRVAVGTALCGSPQLVLLDEPLAGLDPVQAHSLREALAGLRGIQTLVVSSHNLAELERLCDWVVMLKKGRCMRQGTLTDITGQGQVVRWVLGEGDVPLDDLAARLPDHSFSLQGRTLLQQGGAEADLDAASIEVMSVLSSARLAVRGVSRGVALEQRFIDDARVS
ncbi:MAG: ABC transporter ATP-binding protein [Myxococcales bacterium]|nr:ABC transporter ATP-binding protein [Myxococcales bacterium]